MSENIAVVFTSTNTYISANDNPLGFVQTVDVEDVVNEAGEKHTEITLIRLVNDHEEVINDMRSGVFSFKIYNSKTGGGYVASVAELASFKMHLAATTDEPTEDLFQQKLVIKAKAFFYVNDAKSALMKLTEEEDLKNLINILKENQKKTEVATVVLPDTPKKKKRKK